MGVGRDCLAHRQLMRMATLLLTPLLLTPPSQTAKSAAEAVEADVMLAPPSTKAATAKPSTEAAMGAAHAIVMSAFRSAQENDEAHPMNGASEPRG